MFAICIEDKKEVQEVRICEVMPSLVLQKSRLLEIANPAHSSDHRARTYFLSSLGTPIRMRCEMANCHSCLAVSLFHAEKVVVVSWQ